MSMQQTVTDIKGIQDLFVKAQVKPGLFILLAPASAFCDRGSVTGGLVGEDWGKKHRVCQSSTYPRQPGLTFPSGEVQYFL